MRQALIYCLWVSCCSWAPDLYAQRNGRDFVTALLSVDHIDRAEILRRAAAGDGEVNLVSDMRDPRYVAFQVAEGSGIVRQFTYLYICPSDGKCELLTVRAGWWKGELTRVVYDIPRGFVFYDDATIVMQLPFSLPFLQNPRLKY